MLFDFFNFEQRYQLVDENLINLITWGTGVLKENTLLLWDLENIPYRRFSDIKRRLTYAPEKAFMVTKEQIKASKLHSMTKFV